MTLLQAAKIDGVKYIAVKNQSCCPHTSVKKAFEEETESAGLTNLAAEVKVRDDDGIENISAIVPRKLVTLPN